MVDFNKIREEMESGEWEKKKKEREAEEKLKQQIIRQTACFTGHRPQNLFGFNLKDDRYKILYKKLTEAIELCINEENIIRFISGGAIGTDQISYWLVYKLKEKYPDIKNIIAIPFKNQPNAWKDKDTIKWYSKMLERADEIIYVDDIDDFRYRTNEVPVGEYHIGKMQRRNEFMVDNSRIVIAVFNGEKGGTRNCVYYARKMGNSIFRLDPRDNFELDITYGRYHNS
jgi:uncharacterized phage-like protein YoqJ